MFSAHEVVAVEATPHRETARRTARREEILNVAGEAFRRSGYAGVSMSAIASRLGGSKGTLYNYFTSKQELFEAVVRRDSDRFVDRLASHEATAASPRDRLQALASKLLDLVLSPESLALQRLVIAEGPRFPELAAAFYAAGPGLIQEHIEAELRGLCDAGSLVVPSVAAAAQQFRDLVISQPKHLALWTSAMTGQKERAAHARAAVDLLLHAYAPAQGEPGA